VGTKAVVRHLLREGSANFFLAEIERRREEKGGTFTLGGGGQERGVPLLKNAIVWGASTRGVHRRRGKGDNRKGVTGYAGAFPTKGGRKGFLSSGEGFTVEEKEGRETAVN